MLSCEGGDLLKVCQEQLLNDHIADLMGRAFVLTLFAVGCTNEMFLFVFPAPGSHLIQFLPTIGTVDHAGENGHFTHRCNPASAISATLNDVECLLVYNGFVSILKNLPLGGVILHLLFQLVGFTIGLEIDRATEVFLPFQNMHHSGGCPSARVIVLTIGCRRNIHTHSLAVFHRCFNLAFTQFLGNLCRAVSVHTESENLFNNIGSLLIHNQMGLILRVFFVAVGWIGTQRFSCLSLCLKHSTDFLACVLGIEFVDDIEKLSKIAFLLIDTVYTVVDCNETHISLWECNLRLISDLEVITPKTAHILHNYRSDTTCIHFRYHALETLTLEGSAGHPIVNEKLGITETLVISVLL